MDVKETFRAEEGEAKVLAQDSCFSPAKKIKEYQEINEPDENAEEEAVENFEERLSTDNFLYYFMKSGVGYIGWKQ